MLFLAELLIKLPEKGLVKLNLTYSYTEIYKIKYKSFLHKCLKYKNRFLFHQVSFYFAF